MKTTTSFIIALSLLLLSPKLVQAQNVSSPSVDKGVWEFNNTATYEANDDGDTDTFKQKTRIEYGITDKLAFTLSGETEQQEGETFEYDETEFRLVYMLTSEGAPINAAIRVPYDLNHSGDADTIGLELLLGQRFGKWRHLLNIDTQHDIGEKSESGVELDFAWGSYYSFDKFRLGAEYFWDLDRLKDTQRYSTQKHQVGVSTKFDIGKVFNRDVALEFAYYHGISRAADDSTFKNEIEFEF